MYKNVNVTFFVSALLCGAVQLRNVEFNNNATWKKLRRYIVKMPRVNRVVLRGYTVFKNIIMGYVCHSMSIEVALYKRPQSAII